MGERVWVVVEGEIAYYFPYLPHGVFTEAEEAKKYALQLKEENEGTRWPNIVVVEFELDIPGHVEQQTV